MVISQVDLMVDTMKEAFSTTLKSLHWMTSDSQTAALHKLANMMDLIGYPEQVLYCFSPMLTLLCNQVLNSTWLNAKYSEVEVSDDYLMNIVAFQSHQRKEGMKVYTRWVGGCMEIFPDAEEDHYAKKVFPPPGRISEAHGPRCPTEEALSRSTRSTVQTPTP